MTDRNRELVLHFHANIKLWHAKVTALACMYRINDLLFK